MSTMKANFSFILLLTSSCAIASADTTSPQHFPLQNVMSQPEPDEIKNNKPSLIIETQRSSEIQQCSVNNDTCTVKNENLYRSELNQLLDIQNTQERSEFIEANGIKVEHSFLNDVSERFLYIENHDTPSDFIVGEVGAAASFPKEESFLELAMKECPNDDGIIETGPCFTIENGNGQLYAMPFDDRPYILAFNKGIGGTVAWDQGIVVFDSTRFQRVYKSGLWVLEDRRASSSSDNESTVSIRNVGTGRRLFAKQGYDKQDEFGGSPGANDELLYDDQKWRHCVRYTHGEEKRIDCSRYI